MSSTGHCATRDPGPDRPVPRHRGRAGRRRGERALLLAVLALTWGVVDMPVVRDATGWTFCGRQEGASIVPVVMTPYPVEGIGDGGGRRDGFIRGATLDVPPSERREPVLLDRLREMRDRFHITTVSIYGLEGWDAAGGSAEKDALWAALSTLGLQVIVRLEAYDPAGFAFREADVDRLLADHGPLLRYAGQAGHRDRVRYLGLTMPVDDPAVQARLGGPRAPAFTDPQPGYARGAVAAIRGALASTGARIPVYLGVFYGWDNTYPVPSYRSAGADGYFLTNYSYPRDGAVPGAEAPDAVLINEARLRATMDLFIRQYGPDAPVVVEYGFHTRERHGDRAPSQTAGLVRDAAAKRRALPATTRFYCSQYPGVRGTIYFGFNIRKAEGDPPALLDFGLTDG